MHKSWVAGPGEFLYTAILESGTQRLLMPKLCLEKKQEWMNRVDIDPETQVTSKVFRCDSIPRSTGGETSENLNNLKHEASFQTCFRAQN